MRNNLALSGHKIRKGQNERGGNRVKRKYSFLKAVLNTLVYIWEE